MTKYYKATLPTGAVFTRTSVRVYSHMVVAVYDAAEERLACERQHRGTWKLNLKYRQECATGAHKSTPFQSERWTAEQNAREVVETDKRNAAQKAHAQELLDKGVEAIVAEELAAYDERRLTDKFASADRTEFYRDAGWCGRLDLAEKLATSVMKHTELAWILDSVEITKEEYAAIKKAQKVKK